MDISHKTQLLIVDEYKQNLGNNKLLRAKYKLSNDKLVKILKQFNVYKTQQELHDLKMSNAIDLYNTGMSPEKISKELHTSSTQLTKMLRSKGIVLRAPESYNRKYYCNDEYFSVIDSFNKAQIIGMLTADGHVVPKRNKVSIGLQEQDVSYLEWIRKEWNADDYPICLSSKKTSRFSKTIGKMYNINKNYVLNVYSNTMVDDLSKHNIVHRKTWANYPFPSTIPNEFESAFWLGLLEGDGSCNFYSYKRKKRNNNLNEYGVVTFLLQETLAKRLEIFLNENISNCRYSIRIGMVTANNLQRFEIFDPNTIIGLYHLLYDSASFVMKRKHDNFLKILNHYNSKNGKHDIGTLRSFE